MFSRLRSLWRNLVHRSRVERDLDEELRAVVELLVDEKRRTGLSPEEARRAATIELGRIEVTKERVRDARAGAFWDAFVQDVRYGARLLRRNPIFTLTASLSVAICLAANTTVFTLANRLLFRDPVGVSEPERLVDIAPTDGRRLTQPVLPYAAYAGIRDRTTRLQGVYGYQLDLQALRMRTGGSAERVFGTFVTVDYFSVLGVRPAAGRLFGPADAAERGSSSSVVLSHAFWKRRFDGNPAIVGQTLDLNGQPMAVAGIAAEGFNGTSVVIADLWIPAPMATALNAGSPRLAVGGRLEPGVTVAEAAAEIDAIGHTFQPRIATGPDVPGPDVPGMREMRGFGLRLSRASPIPPLLRTPAAAFLSLLMGVASIVLAIACANIAGVLLARATARRREIAVRLAMGAGRGRLIRQLLTETLLLFSLGTAAGLAFARAFTSLLVRLVPALPVPVDVALPLDTRAIVFTAMLSFAAALLSGLVPATQASRSDVMTALKSDSQGPSDRLRLRNAFVIAQIAFSLLLVVAAGLLVRAMHRATFVNLGFDSDGVEVAAIDLSLGGYTAIDGPLLVDELVQRVRALPAVDQATAAMLVPGGGQTRLCCGITVPDATAPDGESAFQPAFNVVAPRYFGTLRIPLVAGRDFNESDRPGSELVTIVSQAAARQYWPGQDPVGKHVLWRTMRSTTVRLSVVGVAGDLKSGGGPPQPLVYLPYAQQYQAEISIIARARSGQRLAPDIRAAVASIDANLPIVSARSLKDFTSPVQLQLRISAAVSVAVGVVGMLLAAIGIYGVTAYAVTRRTREIGIRLAMGARQSDVLRMVLRQGMSLVLIGSSIGLLLAAASSRVLVRLLFGVPPLDPVTFAAATVLLSAIGLFACYVPARRAMNISPVEALRYE
jgi:predicted permease